jgi:hypothetical protein
MPFLGAFGTGLLFIDSDRKNTIRYKCVNLKTVTLGQNHQGIVDKVDRVLHFSLLEIIDNFGKRGLSNPLPNTSSGEVL